MSKKTYHLRLKGYVGGWNFSTYDVDHCLANNPNTPVDILIDSTGGSLATALSIQSAFADHGDVTVHFVGLNASAATIASLGAKHITIDAGAMYLVHKCSSSFFEWSSLNADQFRTLIEDCKKTASDLDKLDLNVARLYARKCKKPTQDLLDLMKVGGWLSAQEALEWGFVDEITNDDDDTPAKLTEATAAAFACDGIPLPPIPVDSHGAASPVSKIIAAIASLFKSSPNPNSSNMEKTYESFCTAAAVPSICFQDNVAKVTESQVKAVDEALKKKDDDLKAALSKAADLEAKVKDLEGKLAKTPAADTSQVISSKGDEPSGDDADPVGSYVAAYNSAKELFDSL